MVLKCRGPNNADGNQAMFYWRQSFGVVGILLILTIGSVAAQTAMPAASPNQAAAQAENPPAGTRLKNWTRSRLDAAKKRWAHNQKKFADCQKQLGEHQKVNRLSLHDQGHFLQQCMSRKL